MTVKKSDVTVVLPVLNEAEAISTVIGEVKSEGYRNILVVDGYSSDGTPKLAEELGAIVVQQHGSGKSGAVKMAFECVETPYMLFMDGDYTYDPKDIKRLLNHGIRHSHVIGARERKNIGRIHRIGNWVITQVFGLLFGSKVRDVCSGMYLLKTDEAKKTIIEEPGFRIEVELAAQSASKQSLVEVPINYRQRIGKKKLSTWRHGLAILYATLKLARRYNPVFLYSITAGFSVIPAALILGWVVLEQLERQVWHSGWALVGIMFLLVTSQALTLASVSILIQHLEKRLTKELRDLSQESG